MLKRFIFLIQRNKNKHSKTPLSIIKNRLYNTLDLTESLVLHGSLTQRIQKSAMVRYKNNKKENYMTA